MGDPQVIPEADQIECGWTWPPHAFQILMWLGTLALNVLWIGGVIPSIADLLCLNLLYTRTTFIIVVHTIVQFSSVHQPCRPSGS